MNCKSKTVIISVSNLFLSISTQVYFDVGLLRIGWSSIEEFNDFEHVVIHQDTWRAVTKFTNVQSNAENICSNFSQFRIGEAVQLKCLKTEVQYKVQDGYRHIEF